LTKENQFGYPDSTSDSLIFNSPSGEAEGRGQEAEGKIFHEE
jgi:hypothetical protein